MKFSTIPRLARTHRRPILATAAFVTAFAIGCASPGPPRPPSLKLPRLVNDLSAQRIGDEVQLHWTTPTKTTDDLDIKGPITAEVCRESAVKSPQSPTQRAICVPVKRFALHSGPSELTDTLPPACTANPLSLLGYRIQIFNSNGHSAGLSPRAFTLSGSAPPPVEQLRGAPTRSGAQLEWKPESTSLPIELDRTLAAITSPGKPRPEPKANRSFNPTSSSAPTEIHLQAGNQASDPGGTIDRTVQRGDTYRYTAQRIRKATLAGHTLEIRSIPSPTVTVFMRDTFPPATPASLAAIPGGTNSADRSIDLSWEPVPDPDVAGYIIYRQEVAATGALTGHSTRLNATPVVGPAFSDHTAIPGRRYAYRVTAIDTSGNESAPSADIQETLREQ